MQSTSPFHQGTWGDNVSWELFAGTELPPPELVTAVFCVAITPTGKIVIARSKRGWGLLGGHIEDGETVEEALVRESQEEGGFTPDQPHLFAHRKVTSTQPIPHQTPGKFYPHPTGYLLYYYAETNTPIAAPTGAEILESGVFSLAEIEQLGTPDFPTIQLGYQTYLEHAPAGPK